jgi:succinate-semialdehyde dehydrogenase/glutarate-semialdehyde dehydrogenase
MNTSSSEHLSQRRGGSGGVNTIEDDRSLICTVNPATGEPISVFTPFTAAEVDQAVREANRAQLEWRDTTFDERATLTQTAADVLTARRAELAKLITQEMGKPIAQAEAEIDKCALTCRFYADRAAEFLADQPVSTPATNSQVSYEPLGIVLAVMPWNFPFWQVIRFAAPALMAGNAVLLKHSPNVTQCALTIQDVFQEAGFPDGLFGTMLIAESQVPAETARLIDNPLISAVTLTGSSRAGAAIGAAAGRALKKCVLELGGSDPFIVLADADLPVTARMAASSRFLNAGQSCIAAKRFIVDENVADEFERLFVQAVADLRVGDPTDPAVDVGPMARADLMDALDRQVQESVRRGAHVLLGGERLPGPGNYFAPTVLTDVTTDMPVFIEETFGPVAPLIRARDADHAVELANQTTFGLGASVWTRDLDRGQRLGRQIQSGALFINSVVTSDPRLPFGGTKRSGYGRELAAEGIREFTNVRTLWMDSAPRADGPLTE